MPCDCDPEDFSPSTLMWTPSPPPDDEEVNCTECDKPFTGELDMSVKENIEAKVYNVVMDNADDLPPFKEVGHQTGIMLLAQVAKDCEGDYSLKNILEKAKVVSLST